MSQSILDLSELINKEIRITENDVEPRYLPNQKEIRSISEISLDVIADNFDKLKKTGKLFVLSNSQGVFEHYFFLFRGDIKKRGYWSYWHYFAFTIITCFAYEELIRAKKHKTIKLNDPANWNPPSFEMSVLAFNYVSAQLYPNAIYSLRAFSEKKNVSIKDLLQLIEFKIKKLHGIEKI
jgi:hypothetical protein